MSGHLDSSIEVTAPLDIVWETLRARDDAGAGGGRVVARDDAEQRVTLRISTAPGANGQRFSYLVERCYDPTRHTVYARRYGDSRWRYSVAWWSYDSVPAGTRIRCVQDFEAETATGLTDAEMTDILALATERALRAAKAHVEAQLGSSHG